MKCSHGLKIFIFLSSLFWGRYGYAQRLFSSADVRGETPLCAQVLGENGAKPLCFNKGDDDITSLDQSLVSIDIYLAKDEIKREVIAMAESQVSLSLNLLQKMGIKNNNSALSERLDKLEKVGIKAKRTPQDLNPELLDKYLVASLRYYELKRRKEVFGLSDGDKLKLSERLQLLEIRYPLISQHNFIKFKDFSLEKLKDQKAFVQETSDEARILDNFLFNDTPGKLSEVETLNLLPKSLAISALKKFNVANNDAKNEIRNYLKDDLQKSLASQLDALSKIESLEECQLLTLHSQTSQRVINSSASSNRVFKKLCECRKQTSPVNDTLVMGINVASMGGLLLCLTPTGVGQVIGCPTAMVAGWAGAGVSAINYADSLRKYNDLNTQSKVMNALPQSEINQAELDLIEDKKSEMITELTSQQVTGLIGFGIGHVGFGGLTKIYKTSKLTRVLRQMSEEEQAKIEKAIMKLNQEDQTKAFVVLEKLDDESRKAMLAKPDLFLKELNRGGRCEL